MYFGDSLCSDAFPVKTLTDWDLILVLEEMEAEGYHPDDNTHHYWEPEEKSRKIIRDVRKLLYRTFFEYLRNFIFLLKVITKYNFKNIPETCRL